MDDRSRTNDPDRVEARIQRLESWAAAAPALYRARVALLGALGYGWLLLVVLMAAGVLLLLLMLANQVHSFPWVFLKLGWPVLLVPVIIARAMWVRIPEPAGIELRQPDTPRLHEMLEDVRARLHAPRTHRVLLTEDCNAAIVQVPRAGILGWPRNYLLLGLPLLMGLAPEALRAVVAHELGHLSRNHGAFGAWVYRVRKTWVQVLEGLEEQGSRLDFGLRDFFRWYVPYFDSYSFVLARAQEYAADACSAEVTSQPVAGRTLVDVAVISSFVHESVLPSLHACAAENSAPPDAPFHDMRRILAGGPPAGQAARSLALALRERTGYGDTHPALLDRLRAIQGDGSAEARSLEAHYLPSVAGPVVSAAEHFLGPKLDDLLDQMNRHWRESVREEWARYHAGIQKRRADLSRLDGAAAERELPPNEAWARIEATLDLRGLEAGLALLRPFVQAHPEHAAARFRLGRALLATGDEGGVAEIEAAMRIDSEAVLPGCEAIALYFAARSRDAEAESWREQARRFLQEVAGAQDEREELHDDDLLAPHGLSEDALRELIDFLEGLPLRRVLLARKVVERLPQLRVCVIGYSVRPRDGLRRSRDIEATVFERLKETLEPLGDFIFFVIEDNTAIAEALERIEGAAVYPVRAPDAS